MKFQLLIRFVFLVTIMLGLQIDSRAAQKLIKVKEMTLTGLVYMVPPNFDWKAANPMLNIIKRPITLKFENGLTVLTKTNDWVLKTKDIGGRIIKDTNAYSGRFNYTYDTYGDFSVNLLNNKKPFLKISRANTEAPKDFNSMVAFISSSDKKALTLVKKLIENKDIPKVTTEKAGQIDFYQKNYCSDLGGEPFLVTLQALKK